MQNKKFISFTKARKAIRVLKLNNIQEWQEFCKSGYRPTDIPSSPNIVYQTEWINWYDWLGHKIKRRYCSFEQARAFVQGLKIRNHLEWEVYASSDNRPINIPINPRRTYQPPIWQGIKDFFGPQYRCRKISHVFISFEKARKIVRTLQLNSRQEWTDYCRSGKKPQDIPSTPYLIYTQYNGLKDWLGYKKVKRKYFLPFIQARKIIRKLKLKNSTAWHIYCKSGQKPSNIPSCPYYFYQQEWKGYGNWLGYTSTRPIIKRSLDYRPFTQARQFVRQLNLTTIKAWKDYCKDGKKPQDIPINPDRVIVYKDIWVNWRDWLGTSLSTNITH